MRNRDRRTKKQNEFPFRSFETLRKKKKKEKEKTKKLKNDRLKT